MNIRKTTIALSVLLSLSATSAHAGGVLGDLINTVAPGVGTQLDRWNHQLGNPVDHAVAAAAESVVPGSGTAMETYWAAQRAGVFNGAPNQQPTSWPVQQPAPWTVQQPVQWPNQPTMGNVCLTALGRSAPGAYMQLGSPCFTWDPYGRQVWGAVVL